MRLLVSLLTLVLSMVSSFAAPAGPLRVLYFDAAGGEQSARGPLHDLMAALGRDAIWFDYAHGATPDAARLGYYDALLVKPDAQGQPALGESIKLPSGQLVSVFVLKAGVTAESFRKELEAGLPSARLANWQKFLDQREPEIREENANVANYEKRPKPLTFQKPFSVKGSMERTQVPADMELMLFASEPDIMKPIAFAWDNRGRLWVAETSDYPHGVMEDQQQGHDKIIICEDTDGDGKADKAVRFAEGLTMVQGVEPLTDDAGNTSILVCDFDRLIKLTDSDGDGKADQTEVLMSGFGVGDTHQLVNSICHGPDGTLWMSQGLHAITRVETPRGIVSLPKSGLMRYDLKNQRLQSFFQYGKAGHNCWGVAFDDYFQPFHKSGDRVAGYYSLPGLGAIETPDEYAGTHSLFDSPLKSNSVEIIGTKGMPAELQGAALIGGYYGNTLDLHRFVDDGAGFKTERISSPIVSSSKAFRPVDVSVGPDGALYACDWFNAVIGHYQASYADPRRDRSHGRIWRITAKGLPAVKQPDLNAMTEGELFAQLGSPERWTRYHARRLLFYRPTDKVVAAADAFLAKDRPEAQFLEAMSVLQSHGAVRPVLLDRLQSSDDFRIRAYAARVVGEWSSQLPDPQSRLAKAIADAQPRVRLEAVVALSHVGGQASLRTALAAADQPTDKFLDYALRQTVRHLLPTAGKLSAELPATQAAYLKKVASSGPVVISPGQAIYEALCLNCHQASAQGLTGVYPPLAMSEWVAGDAQTLIRITMQGLAGPTKVQGKDYGLVPMPPMGLDDQQLADVLTYVRSAFGNQAPAVKPEEVKAVRDATKGRTAPWTSAELGK